MRGPKRWFWQNEYGETSPGWALTGFTAGLVAFGLLVYLINDMHMYRYGPFAP